MGRNRGLWAGLGVTYLCSSSSSLSRPHSGARPRHPHSPGPPAGQASPRERPRRRDPEVIFASCSRPRDGRLLPGRGPMLPTVAVETACMAALRPVSNRSFQREEAGGSANSSVTTRTPVPAVSSGSPERLVSLPQVAEPPEKNLWEQICEGRRPPLTGPGRA